MTPVMIGELGFVTVSHHVGGRRALEDRRLVLDELIDVCVGD
jgi:hypothetical protein